MPLDEKLLGFSNRWYKPAMDSAVVHELESELRVRVVTAVYFCATKLEAFGGRGKRDYQSSHDLEDLMAVVDGRAELAEEIHSGPEDVRAYIAAEFRKLFATREFLDALPGYLLPDQASQARVSILLERLQKIAGLRSV
jgi:predicted nucleotidyltransferase